MISMTAVYFVNAGMGIKSENVKYTPGNDSD